MNGITNLVQENSLYLRLSPAGILHFECLEKVLTGELQQIDQVFKEHWVAGWFQLAASKLQVEAYPSLHFWQSIAARYLNGLCHLPEDIVFSPIQPATEWLEECLHRAPPMPGGEYLSLDRLSHLWIALGQWVEGQVQEFGSLSSFLTSVAPHWKLVGRVCFHLAENKNRPDRPFAFLATYSIGFGAGGRLKHLHLREALQQYAGANQRQALIHLLTPVNAASNRCPWVQELIATGELYQPQAWTASQAYKFLSSVPELEDSGLSVRIPNWWKAKPRPQIKVTVDASPQAAVGASSMLDFDMRIAMGDQEISEEEFLSLISKDQQEGLVQLKGQWVEIDRQKLKEALEHWKTVQKQLKRGGLSFFEGMRLLSGAPLHQEEGQEKPLDVDWVQVVSGKELSQLLHHLRNPSSMKPLGDIQGLQATLRPYQVEGVEWLSLISGLGMGACLADDMGLGKTIQILGLLLRKGRTEFAENPSLLVVPASLLMNWEMEAQRFASSLRLLLLHPSQQKAFIATIEQDPKTYLKQVDLVVTTYSMVSRLAWLKKISWNFLILDEAQAIKNPGTQQTKAVKQLKSFSRIALTGTPVENRLADLWSLFDFLNPGLLGSLKQFMQYVSVMNQSPNRYESLRKLINPYILRRMKTDSKIISDLPDKIESNAYCYLTKTQARHYQAVVDQLEKTLQTIDSKQRRGVVLQTLLHLKQICNHPCHYTGHGNYFPEDSGKFQRLGQLCEELASRQEKVLIFTQFSEIITSLEEYLSKIFGRHGLTLQGDTPIPRRKQLVETFQSEDGPPFFVLSLRAGGTGLTLTAASHVIHFDRWWNPAVENQATDRAFRIGQKKNVQVHKFITQGTIEEQVDEIITSKKKLANDLLANGEEIKVTELSDGELMRLLTLNLERAIEQ